MKNIKNKITIGLIISCSAIYTGANDYLIIVDKTHHKYNVVENPLWEDISPTYTAWTNTGYTKNCGQWTPEINQQKVGFNQSASCDFEEERIQNIRQQNTIDGSLKTIKQNTENQFTNKIDTRSITTSNNPAIIEQNNYNCETWTPDTSTVYIGTTFEQERYCDVDMMQQWNYLLNGSQIDTWQERYTENSGYETQNISGTKAWDSTDSTYTEWTYTGSVLNCGTWNPAINNQQADFSQSTICDFTQTRIRTDRELNSDTGVINNIGTEIETRNLQEIDTRNIITTNNNPLIEQTNYNCETWTPNTNTVYSGTTFEQERYCDKDMMKKWIYSLDGSQVDTYEERYTEKTGYETQNVLGNKAWDSADSLYTDWVYTGTVDNCGTWATEIGQQKADFTQSATCDFEQNRTRTDQEYNSDTGVFNTTSVEVEIRDLQETDNRNIVVTNNPIIIEQNNYNCEVWTPNTNTVYTGTTFEQERYCDVDKMQNWIYSLDGLQVDNWEERFTEQTGYETQDVLGTKEWDATTSLYTEWAYTGTVDNCGTWTPAISNQQTNFSQATNCDFGQTRTRTDRETNSDTGAINVTGTTVETRSLSENANRNIITTNDAVIVERTNYDCSTWIPSSNTGYVGSNVSQERYCNIDKMQKWKYSVNGSQIDTWENRYTVQSSAETQNTSGTLTLNSCSSILSGGHSRGDGLYTINTNQGNRNVLCDMTGGGWTLIFNHNVNYGVFTTESETFSTNENSASLNTNKYSILSTLETFRKNGKFEFKMAWDGYTEKQIWRQTSNPTSEAASGYEAISISSTSNYWGGLEYGFPTNGGASYIDGSVNHPNWFYALGVFTVWGSNCSGIPFSEQITHITSCGVPNVNLWVK